MKNKVTAVLLIAVCISMSLFGCSGKKQSDANQKAESSQNSVTSEKTESSQDSALSEKQENSSAETQVNPGINANLLAEMTDGEKRNLNTFISNFAEAGCEELGYGAKYYDYHRIHFAYLHNLINRPNQKILYNEILGKFGIESEIVDSTLIKYFGETVPHKTATCVYTYEIEGKTVNNEEKFEYADGVFWCEAASGEAYEKFAIVTDMRDNGDGSYEVLFNIYFDEKNMHCGPQPEWYSYTTQEAGENCVQIGTGKARIAKKTYEGKETYELISYKVD